MQEERYIHGKKILKVLTVETPEQCGIPGTGL
jgi:hypothetical protein